ncbi:malto-oligosyltrehalose trehalohydrolase [Sphingobacterium thalpophilum]|uniref:malto-oligosyltrehalose trehalohydrolase n=1 Tax=Sphingobacterium thalpophilum TaxID=259 RepID=UPI003C782F12
MQKTGIEKIGASCSATGGQVRVWAPFATSVSCVLGSQLTIPLQKEEYGYWYAESQDLRQGCLYRINIDGQEYPDPASLSQPEGVHGPSEIIDLSFPWTDRDYQPSRQSDFIIYELHVGTFTEKHDFAGAMERLPHLKDLGITAIEIMPIAQFSGDRNWGYDGVFPFAVHNSYGGAVGLQRFVDACHQLDIAVILDVVYNHLGPEGNYFPEFGPYFTDKYHTPWGQAINYDDRLNHGTRDMVLANVRMWFEDFHIDALRMDAVHAIKDFSPVHILQAIRQQTDEIIAATGKPRYLFVECDLNDRRFLEPLVKNGFAMDAQWLDEFHHALRVAVGEARRGYYEEFDGIGHLAKAYETAYVYDGCYSTHRQKFFGSKADGLPGKQFIVFSQNHDQVGNRMLGERSTVLYKDPIPKLLALAVFVSPFIPLIFMGEEWGTKKPFQYFVSHCSSELVKAVREGRRKEFAEFHTGNEVPDPQDRATFEGSVLDWKEPDSSKHRSYLAYYRALINFRKTNPVFKNIQREEMQASYVHEQSLLMLRIEKEGVRLLVVMNFSDRDQQISVSDMPQWQRIFDTDQGADINGESQFKQFEDTIAAWSGVVFQAGVHAFGVDR